MKKPKENLKVSDTVLINISNNLFAKTKAKYFEKRISNIDKIKLFLNFELNFECVSAVMVQINALLLM
jgi:hypothetical protein